MNPLLARSFEEIVFLFREGLGARKRRRVQQTVDGMSPLLDELFASEAFAPLHASAQQGWAPIAFHRSLHREPIPHRQTPQGYTRANHTKYVAAMNAVVAAQLDLRWRDAKALVLAGALHDVGHLPGGHSMEHAVRAIDPTFSHEARGEHIARQIVHCKHMRMVGSPLEHILAIMRERGPLGALQRITDTLAYCYVDMLACGFMGHQDEGRFLSTVHAFLASLQCIEPDGALRLSHAQPLLEILTWRALLYRDNFLSLEHERCADALNGVMAHLHRHGAAPDQSAFTSDYACRRALFESVDALDAPHDAPRLRAMLDMPNCVSTPMPSWYTHEFESEEALNAWMASQTDDVAHRSFRYIRRPECLLVKTINVNCGGKRLTVGPRDEEVIPIEGPAAILYEWTS